MYWLSLTLSSFDQLLLIVSENFEKIRLSIHIKVVLLRKFSCSLDENGNTMGGGGGGFDRTTSIKRKKMIITRWLGLIIPSPSTLSLNLFWDRMPPKPPYIGDRWFVARNPVSKILYPPQPLTVVDKHSKSRLSFLVSSWLTTAPFFTRARTSEMRGIVLTPWLWAAPSLHLSWGNKYMNVSVKNHKCFGRSSYVGLREVT